MDIKVTNNGKYREVFFEDLNTKISTGLLDEDERISLVSSLLSAALNLLPERTHVFKADLISLIIQNL